MNSARVSPAVRQGFYSLVRQSLRYSMCASAVQITFISLLAVLLALGAAPARNQSEHKPAGTSVTLQNPHHRAAVSESSSAVKQTNTWKSAGVKFSASRECVDGREIAGFSARQAGTL